MARRRCVGFGVDEGVCTNLVNPKVNPYWCEKCDEARMKYLTQQFEKLQMPADEAKEEK